MINIFSLSIVYTALEIYIYKYVDQQMLDRKSSG